ncbi:alpha-amylase family glycosyl hydrolase [Maridesulfovibrio sp.]|uniref:alpha-amylase family glycosyl hydrolase n=1 Tax=Maridesulfovibrio sp. TaxID=2795000 RepID=UPI002AA918BD|nr:alpha-amylase family glycosyl hydrolase [Maridesulfovibrio sp.]
MNKKHFGARLQEDGKCSFRIFAPLAQDVKIKVQRQQEFIEEMIPAKYGFYETTLEKISSGDQYSFVLDNGLNMPDPASQWQPIGQSNCSTIVNHHLFDWKGDIFSGMPMSEMIIYEAHVALFSPEKDFKGIISRLRHLKELGINTLQLMPVAQFSGFQGWGYDTVYPYAVHSPYGTPEELKELVRQCHLNEIAVILDVSFGSIIPVDSLAPSYPPFFSSKHNAPKGRALNFDEKYSYGVREFYIQCALSWLRDYRVDGLRIKDTDHIFDQTPVHFLEELSARIKDFAKANNRTCVLINGDKRNSLRPVLSPEEGGYGLDALYNEDFYCALQSRVTGSCDGPLKDYSDPARMVSAMQYGFAYRGEISDHYLRLQGRNKSELSGCKFIVYSQGHEESDAHDSKCRIIEKSGFEAAKLSAGATLLSPYIPIIFMGDEYGETAPFNFFTDEDCDASVSKCRLNWQNIKSDQGQAMLRLYRKLLKVRKEHPTIHEPCRSRCQVQEIAPGVILIFRNPTSGDRKYAAVVFNFGKEKTECKVAEYLPDGVWTTELYSAEKTFAGTASPLPGILPQNEAIQLAGQSFALFLYSELNVRTKNIAIE